MNLLVAHKAHVKFHYLKQEAGSLEWLYEVAIRNKRMKTFSKNKVFFDIYEETPKQMCLQVSHWSNAKNIKHSSNVKVKLYDNDDDSLRYEN